MITDSKTNTRRTDAEWLDIINECRTSGLSDHEWCQSHHIASSSFYAAIKRLRSSGKIADCFSGIQPAVPYAQDVVKIAVDSPSGTSLPIISSNTMTAVASGKPIELYLNGAHLSIDNDADPRLLSEILRFLGGSYAG